jgi:hypothetical protein
MRKSKLTTVVSAAIAGGVVLAACGGDDAHDPAPDPNRVEARLKGDVSTGSQSLYNI